MMAFDSSWKWGDVGRTLAAVSVLLVAAPAVAGNIYSWQTEDGNRAYTDDIKAVPPRYRDQVETRKTEALGSYERFSAQDSAAAQRYEQQLAARLAHLQQLNANLARRDEEPPAPVGRATIRINGAADNVLQVEGASDAPVIVEHVRVRRVGQLASRHDTVVSQGDRTLAILRGNQEGEVGGPSNVVDEDDLELYH